MSTLSRIFVKGLFTLLPITLTIYLLAWITTRLDALLGEPLRTMAPAGFYFPGAGFLVVMILIFSVGLLVNSYLTQPFINWMEAQFQRLPVVRSIYNPLKDVTSLFAKNTSADSSGQSQRVVMVKMGSVEAMGLVTRDQFSDLPPGTVATESVAVFIPFSYGMGGFTVLVPKADVRETGLAAERAMQLAITGWVKSSKAGSP